MFAGCVCVILKKRRYYILIILLTLLTFYGYTYVNFRESEIPSPTIRYSNESLVYKCCTPLNITMNYHIYYLKTHKTGSTTIQNVIYRFADRYSLDLMFPVHYFYYYVPFSNASLCLKCRTPDNKYHVLANHMRYNSAMKWNQYPNTRMVTSLRHPATLFQSLYEYYNMEDFVGMTFEKFLTTPDKPREVRGMLSTVVYQGYNQMSVDLGFDLKNQNNKTAIQEFIRKIDDEFDFVMIMEFMDASMVLLANLMGWPLQYVTYLKKNARSPDDSKQYRLTKQDEFILLRLNHVDALLYHHFLEKFRKCVRQYGVNELDKQIFKLQELNKQLEEECVAGTNQKGPLGSVSYVPRNTKDEECVGVLKEEPAYDVELRAKQATRTAAKEIGKHARY